MALALACRVDRNEMLRYLGYGGQQLGAALQRRLDAAIALCEQEAPPKGTFAMFPLKREGEGASSVAVAEGAGVALSGTGVSRFLENATHCALLALTLGAQRERELQRQAALNPTDALLYDAACSALAEAAADELQRQVAQAAERQGLVMLPGRFSPGYGDLPLDVQKPLLQALDAYRGLGLAVTESCLLVPRKSITAVVGLRAAGCPNGGSGQGLGAGEREGAVGLASAVSKPSASAFGCASDAACFPNACDACNMRGQCAYRRKEGICHD